MVGGLVDDQRMTPRGCSVYVRTAMEIEERKVKTKVLMVQEKMAEWLGVVVRERKAVAGCPR